MTTKKLDSPYVVRAGDVVHKRYVGGNVHVEYEKAERIWRLFEHDERLSFPEPLELDLERETICYSFLSSDGELASEYVRYLQGKLDEDHFFELLDGVAYGLARLHRELELPTRSMWTMPDSFRQAAERAGFHFPEQELMNAPHAYLHGDFGFTNLRHVRAPNGGPPRVLVFDPSPNGHTTFDSDAYAPVYLDVGCLFAGLNGRFPLRRYPTVRWKNALRAKKRFLATYTERSGFDLDLDSAEATGFAIAFSSFTKWRGPGLNRRLAMAVLYNRLKNNVSWMSSFR